MNFSWVAVSQVDGTVLADLPDLVCDKISDQLNGYTTADATLPVVNPPDDWQRATAPHRTSLVCLDDNGTPIWGGDVTRRPRSTDDAVPLYLATAGAYFDRRYVGDSYFASTGQNFVASSLVRSFAVTGDGINPGRPFRIQLVDGAGAILTNQQYQDKDNATLLSALNDLADLAGGIEWSVTWEWSSPTTLTPVFTVGTRIGKAADPSLGGTGVDATFTVPGTATSATLDEDYTSAEGANNVQALGSGLARSDHIITRDPDSPVYEMRFSPESTSNDTATLNSYARARADAVFNGAAPLSLEASYAEAPRLGTDWNSGDDIGYVIGGTKNGLDGKPYELAPAFPGGTNGVARAIGWELSFDGAGTITPTLQDAD